MRKHIIAISILVQAFLMPNSLLAQQPQPISLNGTWQLSYWEQSDEAIRLPEKFSQVSMKTIDATVPGNVELDLQKAGVIADPMVGNNVNLLRKYEGYQWCYTKTFSMVSLDKNLVYQLCFGGIDCLADVWLNGQYVGSAADMMTEHNFDVSKFLYEGANKLQVIIRSVVMEAQKYKLGTLSIGNFPSEESIFIRKAPHMYGWDILPRLVSAGLWRDVKIQPLNKVHLEDVHYMVANLDTASHHVRLFIDVQLKIPFSKLGKVKALFTLSRNGKMVYSSDRVVETNAFRQIMELPNAELWWPRGYGKQPLYDAKVQLVDESGKELSVDECRVGLRTVKLDRTDINEKPNKPGRFCFIVNGERIFIHGTNWVPLDALHSRDASLLDDAIKMAVDLNCNMIRCWGGNVYEDNRFFDLCDENGILVWQDFCMGCTFYPQRAEFTNALEKELISVVCKLRNHASLILWSGNNEDDSAMRWSLLPFNVDPNKDVVSRGVQARVCYEFDPTRPYLPSSPYYSEEVYQKGSGDELLPENHLWGPRGYYKDNFYRNATCNFVSEIGYHGCPNLESLKKMMSPDYVFPWTKGHEWNDEWVTKSVRRFPSWGKQYDRNNLMINQVNLLFGNVPAKLPDFITSSQIVQAEAMKYFVEMWRSKKFDDKYGIIWWNLRDGWPVISDAIVDYYGSKKLAYYFLKNVQHDVCVMVTDDDASGFLLTAVNDTREPAHGSVAVTDIASGQKVYEGSFDVARNGKTTITHLPSRQGQGMFLVKYVVGGNTLYNHYLYGKAPFKLADYKKWLDRIGIYNKNR